MSQKHPQAAVGLTIKSGWATTVLLTGSIDAPRVVDSRIVELSDPAIPDSRQPYHAGFGTARAAGAELSRLVSSVEQFGQQSVTQLLHQYGSKGIDLSGAGVVVGSLIDPERISNDHIRIHALEGQLFRRVVEDALAGRQLPCSIWRQRDLYASAAHVLHQPEPVLRRRLAQFRADASGSWRAEQKSAALAAWMVLAQDTNVARTGRGREAAS
jgi:hypothetical protein